MTSPKYPDIFSRLVVRWFGVLAIVGTGLQRAQDTPAIRGGVDGCLDGYLSTSWRICGEIDTSKCSFIRAQCFSSQNVANKSTDRQNRD